jgi:serine/threonine-protein kinase
MSDVGAGALVDGKYRILRTIGEGGWGVVHEAENVRTLKHVALKLLRPRPELSAEIRTRFEREAQAAGRIGSDHIVEVFDLGTLADGTHYMVMELLQGQDLASRLHGGPLDPVVAVKIVVQLLEGLAAAHDAGILHRDLKPENLFLVPTRSGEDFVKILDFGISKFNAPDITSATITGAVLGSPVYMAPEQARGLKHVDPRTDLYSVGAVLFETLTGRVPFNGDNFNDLMFKIALAPRPSPLALRPTLDPPLGPLAIKAIAADPKERFQSAGEFRSALIEWLSTQGVMWEASPELRRPVVTTPRNQVGDAEPARTPARAPEAWGAATVAGDTTAGTPLSGASTLGRKPKARSRGPTVAVAALALLLVAAVAVAGVRFLRIERPHVDSAAALPVDLPPPENTVIVSPPTAVLPPLQPVQEAPTVVAPPPAPPEAPPRAGAAPPHFRPGHAASAPAVVSSAPAASASVAAAPPSAPPPPPAPSAPKAVDKVEGREFRTGL